MRALLLVVLAACSSSDEPPCLDSAIGVTPNTILSGPQLAGVSWARPLTSVSFETHGQILSASGLTLDVSVVDGDAGATGTETVLWLGREQCQITGVFAGRLQRDAEVLHVDIAPEVSANAVTFDGTRYQLFWIDTMNRLRHQSLGEDGTLGPLHELGTTVGNDCIQAASDRAGTTFVRWGSSGYMIDAATGDLQAVYASRQANSPFFFAGKFHLREGNRVMSFDPTGAPISLSSLDTSAAKAFLPTSTQLFVVTNVELIELDTALRPVVTRSALNRTFGVFGEDLISMRRTGNRVVLERAGIDDVELAVDTPVEACPE